MEAPTAKYVFNILGNFYEWEISCDIKNRDSFKATIACNHQLTGVVPSGLRGPSEEYVKTGFYQKLSNVYIDVGLDAVYSRRLITDSSVVNSFISALSKSICKELFPFGDFKYSETWVRMLYDYCLDCLRYASYQMRVFGNVADEVWSRSREVLKR